MKRKYPEDSIQRIQIDAITGEYYIIIPEWATSELSWYADTEVNFILDGNELILSEEK